MAVNERNHIVCNSFGDGIELNEYQGSFSLNATTKGQNDVHYSVWCFLSKWSKAAGGPEPDTKKRVMSVRLGTKVEALSALRTLHDKIKNWEGKP